MQVFEVHRYPVMAWEIAISALGVGEHGEQPSGWMGQAHPG